MEVTKILALVVCALTAFDSRSAASQAKRKPRTAPLPAPRPTNGAPTTRAHWPTTCKSLHIGTSWPTAHGKHKTLDAAHRTQTAGNGSSHHHNPIGHAASHAPRDPSHLHTRTWLAATGEAHMAGQAHHSRQQHAPHTCATQGPRASRLTRPRTTAPAPPRHAATINPHEESAAASGSKHNHTRPAGSRARPRHSTSTHCTRQMRTRCSNPGYQRITITDLPALPMRHDASRAAQQFDARQCLTAYTRTARYVALPLTVLLRRVARIAWPACRIA